VTARVIVTCDAVHPLRVPPKCRGFLVVDTRDVAVAYEWAAVAGWTQDVGDVDSCPSCSRAGAR
jgi:hypothetical protein